MRIYAHPNFAPAAVARRVCVSVLAMAKSVFISNSARHVGLRFFLRYFFLSFCASCYFLFPSLSLYLLTVAHYRNWCASALALCRSTRSRASHNLSVMWRNRIQNMYHTLNVKFEREARRAERAFRYRMEIHDEMLNIISSTQMISHSI